MIKVIHLYTLCKYADRNGWGRERNSYKIRCTGEFKTLVELHNLQPVTVPINATCPECLDSVIPKLEHDLEACKINRDLTLKMRADETKGP